MVTDCPPSLSLSLSINSAKTPWYEVPLHPFQALLSKTKRTAVVTDRIVGSCTQLHILTICGLLSMCTENTPTANSEGVTSYWFPTGRQPGSTVECE
jgi:hypothetical protein